MYSPKIKEEYIPILVRLSNVQKVPMTKLVNRIINDYLKRSEINGMKIIEPEKGDDANDRQEKDQKMPQSHWDS